MSKSILVHKRWGDQTLFSIWEKKVDKVQNSGFSPFAKRAVLVGLENQE
jgi:hypothetical protein